MSAERKPTMIPMSRVRHVLETWGDEYDEVPWGIFLVIPVSEWTAADHAWVEAKAAELAAMSVGQGDQDDAVRTTLLGRLNALHVIDPGDDEYARGWNGAIDSAIDHAGDFTASPIENV